MAVSTIDGTVEEATVTRSRKGLNVYDKIVFRLADGSSKTWAKPVAHQSVAAYLWPGASGRFYLFSAWDHRGVHGARTADGAAVHFSTQFETFSMVLALVNLAVVLLSVVALDRIQMLSLILFLLFVPAYLYFRNLRVQAQAQFDADSSYHPPAAAAPALGTS